MSFIQREIDKVSEALRSTPEGATYDCLYAVQQALMWALDPDAFASPSSVLEKFHSVAIVGTKGTGVGREAEKLS